LTHGAFEKTGNADFILKDRGGGIFFISSLAAAYLAFVLKEFHHTLFFVMDGLFILAFVCSVVVGKLGTLLICTKVQG